MAMNVHVSENTILLPNSSNSRYLVGKWTRSACLKSCKTADNRIIFTYNLYSERLNRLTLVSTYNVSRRLYCKPVLNCKVGIGVAERQDRRILSSAVMWSCDVGATATSAPPYMLNVLHPLQHPRRAQPIVTREVKVTASRTSWQPLRSRLPGLSAGNIALKPLRIYSFLSVVSMAF